MKMSEVFTLPVAVENLDVVGAVSAESTMVEDRAVERAVNHHDALVEALRGMVRDTRPTDPKGDAVITACELLEAINNDK